MGKRKLSRVNRYLARKRRRRMWAKVVSVLACVVVFCTTYALILPAVTMEREPACGLEAHTHEDDCYTEQRTLICSLAEDEAHSHDDSCWKIEQILTCDLSEHTHTEECYPDTSEAETGTEEAEGTTEDTESAGTETGTECEEGTVENTESVETESDVENAETETETETTEEAETETEEETETETEEETETLAENAEGTYDWQDETLTVVVTLAEGVDMPENAVLKVLPVTKTDEAYGELEQAVSEYLQDNEDSRVLNNIYPMDIHLEDADGKELALPGTAAVTVTFAESIGEEGEEPSLWTLFHQGDDGMEELTDAVIKRKYTDGVRAVTGFSFETAGFSNFVLAQLCGDENDAVKRYMWEDDTLTVTVTLPEDAGMEEDAVLKVQPLTEEDDAYGGLGQALSELLWENEDSRVLHSIYPMDIHMEDADGQELELPATASVTVTFAEPLAESGENPSEWAVFHQNENEIEELTGAVIECGEVDEKRTVAGFSFETQSFSYFVLAEFGGIMGLDETIYGEERTDSSFTVTYAGTCITFNLVDTEGNPIEASVRDITAAAATRYIFGTKDSATAEEDVVVENIVPEIEGYTFRLAVLTGTPGYYVYSVATAGYTNVVGSNVAALRFYTTEPLSNGQYLTKTLDATNGYTVTVTYIKAVEATDHGGAVINLFDYWITQQDGDTDGDGKGINSVTGLRFSASNGTDVSASEDNLTANKWTGNARVCQGIVGNVLGSDGYPVLSGERDLSGFKGSSLRYLFDPTMAVMVDGVSYKESHRDVKGLLQLDSSGYYFYNCRKNFAEYDQEANRFTLYDLMGVKYKNDTGQFFPFDSLQDVKDWDASNQNLNHYFGMTLSTRFIQRYGGYVDETHNNGPTVFEFSGDDDVWIFIDDVLVADLGGIHDAASVKINFAVGTVVINEGTNYVKTSSIVSAFETAGKDGLVNDTTLAAGTHKLDFFYLERGNNASNCSLRFNLPEVPASSIYKVNQYGDPVPGATFAVYAANSAYEYIDKENGSTITLPDPLKFEENGDISDGEGNVCVKALYCGTTDQNGEMIFKNEGDYPLTLEEMRTRFGNQFILREIGVPAGYRLVTDDIHLYIAKSGGHAVLLCDNAYQSGAWASSTLLVKAKITDDGKIYVYNKDNSESMEEKNYVTDGVPNGIMFAVVFTYNGSDQSGLSNQELWSPVYGTSIGGYTIVKPGEGGLTAGAGMIEQAIYAAKQQRNVGGSVAFSQTSTGDMQLELKNLPGSIKDYYYMEGNEVKYTVGYYWTSAASLSEAKLDNTWRVVTDGGKVDGYSGFERTFGATIEVPNLNNRMYAQKLDEDGNLVNGAAFAMYNAVEEADEIYYLADNDVRILLDADEDLDNIGTATVKVNESNSNGEYSYTIDPLNGVINVTPSSNTTESPKYTISPAKGADGNSLIGITKEQSTSGEDGTADFDGLCEGKYYLREIAAPDGYRLNSTEVMVLVTKDGIYANAGTTEDNVTVARGPGYVVSTLHQFASEGQIDNTLTWVYARLFVNTEDIGTFDWLQRERTATATTYLKYAPKDGKDVLFNYTLNDYKARIDELTEAGVDLTAPNPEKVEDTRRLYTDKGWGYLEIYQDTDYKNKAISNGASYEELSGDIATLFSRSVFVQVTDEYWTTDMDVIKVDKTSSDITLGGAGFVLYKQEDDGQKHYYQYQKESGDAADGTTDWVVLSETVKLADVTLTSGADGKISFRSLRDGIYYLEEVTAPDGYNCLENPIAVRIFNGKVMPPENESWPEEVKFADTKEEGGKTIPITPTLTVSNTPGYKLPETGGHGALMYMLGGVILMSGSLLYGICQRRKRIIRY